MSATIPLPGDRSLGGDRVFVIAEIGKNFIQTEEDRPQETYLRNAKELIDAAAEAGADAVKFQTHILDDEQYPIDVASPHAPGLDRYRWVARNTAATPPAFWREIRAHCAARGILFFSTPMSRASAKLLRTLDVPLWKIGSGDVRDALLLREVLKDKLPVMLSTGMVSFAELAAAMKPVLAARVPHVLFYCVSHYPAPPESFNLASLRRLAREYPKAIIGFSDHSLGHDAALAAVGLGAQVIEKHFSLSRDLWGPDHKASMTPKEFAAMTAAIRARKAVDPRPYEGREDAELEGATNKHRPFFQKTLVAARDLPAGAAVGEEDVAALRPQSLIPGIPAWELDSMLGRETNRILKRYDAFTIDALS